MSVTKKMTRPQRRAIERAARAGVKRKSVYAMPEKAARLTELNRLERCGVFSKDQAEKLREQLAAVSDDRPLLGGCDE